MEIFNPKHPNANIHGMVDSDGSATCKTANGKMCTGCCTALRIEEDNILLKEEGHNCPAQVIQKGCNYVIQNQSEKRFKVCPVYHCSSDISKVGKGDFKARQRVGMELLSSLSHNETNKEEFNKNSIRILGK